MCTQCMAMNEEFLIINEHENAFEVPWSEEETERSLGLRQTRSEVGGCAFRAQREGTPRKEGTPRREGMLATGHLGLVIQCSLAERRECESDALI